MKTYHHLIAAVDFTPSCRRALREAIRRALLDGAKLTAVHVMDDVLVEQLKRALATDESSIRADFEIKLRKFVNETDAGGAAVPVELRVGSPFVELVEACHSHGADLLVMGAKGSRDEPHRIGVIAARCVRKAPVDVLVVRHEALQPFRRVVACVDFSENAAKAVQCALHLAQHDKAALDCLYVYQSAMALALDYGGIVSPIPPVTTDEEDRRMWQKELQNFLEPLLRKAGDTRVNQVITETASIREGIMEHIAASGADLVVLGTRGKGSLRHMLIGTTAEKIVQHAPCSILAVKPDALVTEEA